LTDFVGIATWLAKEYPRRKLLPDDAMTAQAAIETMHFCVQHIHGDGFRRVFTPERYAARPDEIEAVKSEGRKIVAGALLAMNDELAGKDYLAKAFSIADAALFYVEFWADKTGMELPPNCLAHYQRMKARPAVRQVLAEEGYR
jgi:glutathione S-transferase